MPTRYFAVEGPGARELAAPDGPAWQVLDDAGAAVYEGLRTYDGTCFFGFLEHMRRLAESCRDVDDPPPPFEPDDVHAALVEAGARFFMDEGSEARVRIDVCRGPARSLGTDSHVVLSLSAFGGVARERKEGVAVRTTSAIRRERPTVKDSAWTVTRARHVAEHPELAACYEPMLVDDAGRLLEGVQSNLVLVRDGRPWTAPGGVLRGVTRDAVLELSPEEPVLDFVTLARLPELEEAFLTSSVRGVVPIVEVDKIRIGDGRPGPLTRELIDRYEAHTERARR